MENAKSHGIAGRRGRPSRARVPSHLRDRSRRGDNFVQKDGVEPLLKDPWHWAAPRLTQWDDIRRDDYDFWWMEDASEELLTAGCLYEYARESDRFRCMLVIDRTPKEERFWSAGCQDHPSLPLIEFERSPTGHIDILRSGWETWLRDFANELIANKSFAELLGTNQTKVQKSLDALGTYCLYPKAVELPGRHIITHGDAQPEFGYPGSQVFQIEVCWRHYNNKEIGDEMERLAASCRPPNEKGPQRTGKKRESKVRSDLKALSAMRIWKLHERNPWKRLDLVANVCRYKGCVKEAAAYKRRCKEGHGDEPMSKAAKAEMTRARKHALSLFQYWFPWDKPSNH
jgi:hypothetical protein